MEAEDEGPRLRHSATVASDCSTGVESTTAALRLAELRGMPSPGSEESINRQTSDDSTKDDADLDEPCGRLLSAMPPLYQEPKSEEARQDSDGSADDMHQAQSYYDDSCSEHSEGAGTVPLLQRGRRTRRQLKQRVEGLVTELRKRREVFNRKQRNLAQSVNQRLRHQWLAQQERLVLRSKQMSAKLQSGRSRAWRHKWMFTLVQADFIASAFWLGFQPQTYFLYYTAQVVLIIGCKVLDYRVKAQHYFLLDFCFFANAVVLFWLWVLPKSGLMFDAAEGVCGLLAISVVAFRNSCVPHDFVRISHAYVHFPAVIVMLSVKLKCDGDLCLGLQAGQEYSLQRRFLHAWAMYATWALLYYSVIFVIAKKRIIRKQRDTLYNYFAITLGFNDMLPKWLKPYSKAVFMLGHMSLFLCGVWWIFLPFAFQVLGTILMLTAFFHNGGRYYVDHFWKTYERNTLLYVDAAYSAMSKESTMSSKDEREQGEPKGGDL